MVRSVLRAHPCAKNTRKNGAPTFVVMPAVGWGTGPVADSKEQGIAFLA